MNDYLYMNAMSQLSSWVEYIMAKAPEHFKINSDVKSFYDYYQQAQSEMNGTAMPQNRCKRLWQGHLKAMLVCLLLLKWQTIQLK